MTEDAGPSSKRNGNDSQSQETKSVAPGGDNPHDAGAHDNDDITFKNEKSGVASPTDATENANAKNGDPTIAAKQVGEGGKMGTSRVCLGLLFGFGTVLFIGGLLVSVFWMTIYSYFLFREIALSPTSRSFGMWEVTPIPMYLEIYLYNWTNAEQFSSTASEKPHFVEMGPYVFREVDVKVNQTWNDNATISYYQKRSWYFEEEMSNGSLSDEITNLNVITTTVGYNVRNMPLFVRLIADGILRTFSENLFITRTARELLFDGYTDSLLEFVQSQDIPGVHVPFDRFGWFYGRNESVTYDGSFNMNTGEDELSHLGTIRTWNYRERTDFWPDECGRVRGTTGEIFPPAGDREDIEIFAPELCTSLKLHRGNDVEYHGITGYQFSSTSATFDNGSFVSERSCYCEGVECQPSGVLNVSLCRFGAPAFISSPHFYQADEFYTDSIDGMHPDESDYRFVMTIEPNTGVPLEVKAQLQINVLVQPISGITLFDNINTTYVPMLWFRQEAMLTNRLASMIKFILTLPTLGLATFIAITCIGTVLLIVGVYLCLRRQWKSDDNQRLLKSDETNDHPAVAS